MIKSAKLISLMVIFFYIIQHGWLWSTTRLQYVVAQYATVSVDKESFI